MIGSGDGRRRGLCLDQQKTKTQLCWSSCRITVSELMVRVAARQPPFFGSRLPTTMSKNLGPAWRVRGDRRRGVLRPRRRQPLSCRTDGPARIYFWRWRSRSSGNRAATLPKILSMGWPKVIRARFKLFAYRVKAITAETMVRHVPVGFPDRRPDRDQRDRAAIETPSN